MRANVNRFRGALTFILSLLTVLYSSTGPSCSQDQRTKGALAISSNTVPTTMSSNKGPGDLLAMLPGGKTLGACPLKHTAVKAQVSGYVARVSVKQTFQNPFKDKIEALYTFPLPENAAVDEMTMRIGNRVIKGIVRTKEEARKMYDQAKSQGHAASLLDQDRPNVFTQSVANIEPGAVVEIEIKYVDLLPYDSGNFTFVFPTVVGARFNPGQPTEKTDIKDLPHTSGAPRINLPVVSAGTRAGHDISIEVDIAAGVPISNLQSKLHEVKISPEPGWKAHVMLADKATIPNRDFVLTWGVAKNSLESGYLTHRDNKSGYFTLMLLPPKRVKPVDVAPKEMIFLIDCSGSQAGQPLAKAKETMDYIVDHMNADDTLQILAFNNTIAQFAPTPQKASASMRQHAKGWIEALQANGGTWMAPAVEKVCSLPADDHRLRIVVFMTDGYVGNDFEVRGLVRKYRGTSRWFPFGTGRSVNRFLIDGIAQDGGGEAEYVLLDSPGCVVGEKFYKRISSPILTDVKLNFQGVTVKEVYPAEVSDVWAEKPLYFKGRYLAPGAGTITLTGFSAGKPYKQTLNVVFPEKQNSNDVIKSIWARSKVDRLMAEDWLGAQKGSVNKALKDEIVKTAVDYHLMTQYTSFVAVEERIVTKNGKTTTVPVKVEIPDGVSGAPDGKDGEGDPGSGLGLGTAGGEIALKIPAAPCRAMGNIGPYRRAMLMSIAANLFFTPEISGVGAILLVNVGKDGKLLSSEIQEGSGYSLLDKQFLSSVRATEFAPLPDWFKGESITFKIELSKLQAVESTDKTHAHLESYRQELIEKLVASWKAKPGSGQLKLLVGVKRGGDISRVQIFKGSGNNDVDEQAIVMVKALKLPPLPASYKPDLLVVALQFSDIERRNGVPDRDTANTSGK